MKQINFSNIEEELLVDILQSQKSNLDMYKNVFRKHNEEEAIRQNKKICDHFIKKVRGNQGRELKIE